MYAFVAWDVARIVFLLGALYLLAISVEILIRYLGVAYRGGLLPQHIWLIVFSYLSFVVASAVDVAGRLGHPQLSPATPLRLIGLLVGAIALWRVRQHVLARRFLENGGS